MPAELTEAEFSKHVNTKFQVRTDSETPIDLELDEVKGYSSRYKEHDGMERFSIFFNGPKQPFLEQTTYTLEHEQMGEFEIFLVPIARRDDGFRYEAVFNYFKSAV
ncbi:MAG TPA: hypothetical protein VLL54_22200 [Pyrinomonadaceae bacterium]|nr:hypothetical protein [Pyrinomonadaceae bacterium]